jgi:hypothetical protein
MCVLSPFERGKSEGDVCVQSEVYVIRPDKSAWEAVRLVAKSDLYPPLEPDDVRAA